MNNNLPTKIIQTKVIPLTNTRSSKIKAFDAEGNIIIIKKDLLDGNYFKQHLAVAEILMNRMGWKGKLIGGETQWGYAFAIVN